MVKPPIPLCNFDRVKIFDKRTRFLSGVVLTKKKRKYYRFDL